MEKRVDAYAVQFLSRDCVPDDLTGTYEGIPFAGAPFSFEMTLRKGGGTDGAPSSSLVAGRYPGARRPLVAHPWPMRPDIGAVQSVDPYYDARWPAYLELQGNVRVLGERSLSMDEWIRCVAEVHNVLWGSFSTMEEFKYLPDQKAKYENFRYTYLTTMSDLYGNPFPAEGRYKVAYIGAPTGPGFVRLPVIHATVAGGAAHELSRVWSQALSVPDGATENTAEQRAQAIKRHWNSYGELRDAEKHAQQGEVKAAVRSAASAIEASLRFYGEEWGFNFRSVRQLSFDGKIDAVLKASSRPPYSDVDRSESEKLLSLYDARNAMHEGDCYFKDERTGGIVRVDIAMAREFVASARRFVLWLDSLA